MKNIKRNTMKKYERIYVSFLIASGALLLGSAADALYNGGKEDLKRYYGSGDEIRSTEVIQRDTVVDELDEGSGLELFPCVVSKAVDGDTIYVAFDSGLPEVKVRFIGVNTPESVSSDMDKNCEEGEVASAFTKERLAPGTEVYLEYDKDVTDQYGRTLAYVWLSDDVRDGSYEDFCSYNYGAVLLQNTYCEAVYYAPNGKYREWYEQLEKEYQ